jgi:hypothetical protein
MTNQSIANINGAGSRKMASIVCQRNQRRHQQSKERNGNINGCGEKYEKRNGNNQAKYQRKIMKISMK